MFNSPSLFSQPLHYSSGGRRRREVPGRGFETPLQGLPAAGRMTCGPASWPPPTPNRGGRARGRHTHCMLKGKTKTWFEKGISSSLSWDEPCLTRVRLDAYGKLYLTQERERRDCFQFILDKLSSKCKVSQALQTITLYQLSQFTLYAGIWIVGLRRFCLDESSTKSRARR